MWAGDVGWNTWEEINRIFDPLDTTIENFGWPCYEGNSRQPGYDGLDLPLCEALYGAAGAVAGPYYTYNHDDQVVPGEACPPAPCGASSSVTGLAFYPTSGGTYPSDYHGALFFADYSRDCVWAMKTGGGALPDPGNIVTISANSNVGPVNLISGPGGDIFYPGFTTAACTASSTSPAISRRRR